MPSLAAKHRFADDSQENDRQQRSDAPTRFRRCLATIDLTIPLSILFNDTEPDRWTDFSSLLSSPFRFLSLASSPISTLPPSLRRRAKPIYACTTNSQIDTSRRTNVTQLRLGNDVREPRADVLKRLPRKSTGIPCSRASPGSFSNRAYNKYRHPRGGQYVYFNKRGALDSLSLLILPQSQPHYSCMFANQTVPWLDKGSSRAHNSA